MAVLPQNQISIGNGIVIFSQFLGGAIFLAIAESLFTSRLLREIAANAPSVDAQAVINAGAEAVATVVNSENLAAVIEAYNVAITTTYVSLSAYLSWNRSIRTHHCIVRHGCRRRRCVLRFVWDALGQCEGEIIDGWRGMISFPACLITAPWKGYLRLAGIATQNNFRLLDFLYSLAKTQTAFLSPNIPKSTPHAQTNGFSVLTYDYICKTSIAFTIISMGQNCISA
jgi:hypothetical protein